MTFVLGALTAAQQRIDDLESELAAARERLTVLTDESPQAVVIHSEGLIRWLNQAAALVGGRPEEMIGGRLLDWVHPESKAVATARIAEVIDHGIPQQASETLLTGFDGRIVAVETRACRTWWEGRPAVHLALWDVTARRDLARRLAWEASHDSLTGLLNRQAVTAHLAGLLAAPGPSPALREVAALLIDLDGFKGVNDSLGHLAGDRLLARIGGRLRDAAAGRAVGRIGGDEFLVVWQPDGAGEAAEVAARLTDAVVSAAPAGGAMTMTASTGWALGLPGEVSPEDLVDAADAAMYRAKRRRSLPR